LKRFCVVFLLCLIPCFMLAAGCAKHKPEKTAEELAAEGQAFFEAKDYREAITAYERLRDWYPFSVHAKDAELKVADAYYLLEEYDQALAAYQTYYQLHPTDPQIPYVLYRIGRCDFDQMVSVDRDQTPAANALESFRRLINQFPDHEYAEKAEDHIQDCLENLAAKEHYVGKFYFKSEHYKAALHRFQSVVNDYPDFGLHAEAKEYIERCNALIAASAGEDDAEDEKLMPLKAEEEMRSLESGDGDMVWPE
jgi:outer membrane protein assembly factor BamD